MNEKEILSSASDTITQEPVTLTIDVRPEGKVQRLGQFLKLVRKKRTFQVRPLTLGTLVRISKLLLDIDVKEIEDAEGLANNYKLMHAHGEAIAEVIALAVTNSKERPPASLVSLFLNNLTPKELMTVLVIVIKQMQVQNFMISIVLVKGLNLHQKASPQEPKEIIAFGDLLAE